MVFCSVEAFGKVMTAQLPVMDHRNKAISNPDAFQVNVAMQRCLAKAIALHGIGLYIYNGEDLPEFSDKPADVITKVGEVSDLNALTAYWKELPKKMQEHSEVKAAFTAKKTLLTPTDK